MKSGVTVIGSRPARIARYQGEGDDMTFGCRCRHAPFSPQVLSEANRLLGRRSFLIGAAAAGVSMLLPWRARAAGSVTVLKAARLFNARSMETPGRSISARIASFRCTKAMRGAARPFSTSATQRSWMERQPALVLMGGQKVDLSRLAS
jgi:hypothetical protein